MIVALLFLAMPVEAPSATASQATTFAAEAEIVRLDVVVTDSDGRPVRDLRRDEFEVREDGALQRVLHFRGVAAPTGSPGQATQLDSLSTTGTPDRVPPLAHVALEARGPHRIVIVVDDLHLGAPHLLIAQRALARFMTDELAAEDETALVTTSGIRGVRQRFTHDRAALLATLERIGVQDRSARSRQPPPYISEAQAEQIEGQVLPDGGMTNNEAFELAVSQFMAEYFVGRPVAEEMTMTRVREILDEGARSTLTVCTTIESVIRSLGGMPGRKTIVLLSDGFRLQTGTMYQGDYDLRRLTDAATRSGVVVHTLDVSGLSAPAAGGDLSERSPGDYVARQRIETFDDAHRREGLRRVADETGGMFVFNNNDIGLGLRRVLADENDYYQVAYEPTRNVHDGRFRSVSVRVVGRPGKFMVRTRRGYFAAGRDPAKPRPKPLEAQRRAEEDLQAAFQSVAPLRGLSVEVRADFLDLPELGTAALVRTGVGAQALAQASEVAGRSTMDLVLGVVDAKGASVFEGRDTLEVSARSPTEGEIDYVKPIPLRPGRYEIVAVARSQVSGRTGSAFASVVIPDVASGELALSDLLFSAAAPGSLRFRHGVEIEFVVFAYNGPKGGTGLSVKAEVRRAGAPLLFFSVRPTASGASPDPNRVAYGGRLPVADLAPGAYELLIRATDPENGFSIERGARLVLE